VGNDGGDDEYEEEGDDIDYKEGNVHILVEKIADSDFVGTTGSDQASKREFLGAKDDEEFIMLSQQAKNILHV
jgi:hypothetical protein